MVASPQPAQPSWRQITWLSVISNFWISTRFSLANRRGCWQGSDGCLHDASIVPLGPSASKSVGGTPHATTPAIEYVRVNHGRPNIRVTQQLLDRPNIVAIRQQMGGERMTQRMAPSPFLDLSRIHGLLHRPLHHGLMEMVSSLLTRLHVSPAVRLRKDELPNPLAIGVGILLGQCTRQSRAAITIG